MSGPPPDNSLLPQQFYWDTSNPAAGKIWAGVPVSVDPAGRQLVIDTGGGLASGTYVPLSGGAMTGPLALAADPGAAMHAATKQYVDTMLPLTGGTLSPGPLVIGAGTAISMLAFNGSAGAFKGMNWRNAGVNRWALNTDASDNLGLYAYASDGSFVDTGLLFTQSSKTITTHFGIYTSTSYASPPNAVAGVFLNAANTGVPPAQGHKLTYTSSAGNSGFDIGLTVYSLFNAAFVAGQVPSQQGTWVVAISPNDQTNYFGINCGEWNIVNRGADQGWMRSRAGPRPPSGGLLMVPESSILGASGGGEGKNVTYGFATASSAAPNSTGFPCKFYNNYLVEPNSTAGRTGRGMYMTGDISGVASQYPYGPLGIEGTWLHGLDHTLATYTDGNAQTLKSGQSVAWTTGTAAAPTGVATISAAGAGANNSLVLTPAGTGTVTLAGPVVASSTLLATTQLTVGNSTNSGTLIRVDAVLGSGPGLQFYSAGSQRWKVGVSPGTEPGGNADSDLSFYAYSDTQGFLGTVLALRRSLAAVFAAGAGFFGATPPAAKPAVAGSRGGNAALASLLTALAAYGLITDSSSA